MWLANGIPEEIALASGIGYELCAWLASCIPEKIGYMCWQITLSRQVAF